MATRLRKASVTEVGVRALWTEYEFCSEINRDLRLPFYTLQVPEFARRWDTPPAFQRRQAELRYEIAGYIIDLYKTGQIRYSLAISKIQDLFS